MEIKHIKIGKVKPNKGQIEGLAANPRQWTKAEIDRIANSLAQTPELFEARPIIVYEVDGEYIALGGNLRLEGAKRLKLKEVPVIVLPQGIGVEKLREIVIKDNGSFGQWDFDALAKEWNDLPLFDWGVPEWDTSEADKGDGQKQAKEDDFDENTDSIAVRCKKGDIWQLGEHRLMCGDSTDQEQVKMLMGG